MVIGHPTWVEWLALRGAGDLFELPAVVAEKKWDPGDHDRIAAWGLYTELRTRIAVQPLHYLYGDEEAALTSLADLFKMARDFIRAAGPEARHFGTLTAFALNRVLRPFTAEWHKRRLQGDFKNEDACHEFRQALRPLQEKLRAVTTVLGALAEGESFVPGSQSWPLDNGTQLPPAPALHGGVIPFDIAFDKFVPEATANEIRWHEHNEIRGRRGHTTLPNHPGGTPQLPAPETGNREMDVRGLAISGGGIRSATFALGTVQRLAEKGALASFDYLSTVSGGGYLGSFLSTYCNTASDDQQALPNIGLDSHDLPFIAPAVGESAPLRHLRGHSKYLISGGLVNALNMVLLGLYGVLSTALVFWPLLAGFLLLVAYFQGDTIRAAAWARGFSFGDYLLQSKIIIPAGIAIAAVLILAPVAIFCRLARKDEGLLWYQWVAALVVVACTLAIAFNLIPASFRPVEQLFHAGMKEWLPNLTLITGGIAALQRFWAALDSGPSAAKVKQIIAYIVMALAGPAFVVLLFFWLGHYLIVEQISFFHESVSSMQLIMWLTFAPLAFALLFLDVNQSSLHPFYRRKLSEAFLIEFTQGDTPAQQVQRKDGIKLSELREHNPTLPYHLLNCALNAPSSENQVVRGRGADFFFFSQGYSGSASTGYFTTKKWEDLDSRLNLGTAMAISAGAVSPFMGVSTIPGGNFLLTLYNIRLDYWLAKPGKCYALRYLWRAGPWYLMRQGFGWMDEASLYVNASDGGHIENLGVYELLRRRCRFIVAIDGECDPQIACGSLMRLIRLAQIDFNVSIEIDMSRFQRNENGTVPFHFALATIRYPALNAESPAAIGYLLYVKLSLTGNEPPQVMDYRAGHREFPHESTADQFFSEAQFEAYRALGYHVAGNLFSQEILGTDEPPGSFDAWFGAIAAALHDPNHN